MSSIAVSENIIAVCKGNLVDCYNYKKHDILQYDIGSNESVSDIAISSNNQYLAIITTVTKKLCIYKISNLECIRTFTLPRSASKIRFAVNNTQIFIADKTGDVLLYDILKEEAGIKILGHLSLLLNVLQTTDGKFIITSDRDEKIRVSHFPNTYNIQTYCLGHTEFVNHIEILPHNDQFIVSASGDGTIKCWNYVTGKLCYTFDVNIDIEAQQLKDEFRKAMDDVGVEVNNLPIVNFCITYFKESYSLIVVTLHSYKKLLLYSLRNVKDNLIHRLEKEITVENIPASLKFHDSCLFIYDDVNLRVSKYAIINNDSGLDISLIEEWKVFDDHVINGESINDLDSIKVMFKRKFDNVQEYQERKKLRLAKPT